MSNSVEHIIFENLIHNDEYFKATIPHLKEEYFDTKVEKVLIKFIKEFSEKHNKAPNQKILSLMVKEYSGFTQEEFLDAKEYVNSLTGIEENRDWLLERTEKFCKDKALFNAIMESIQIMDGKNNKLNKEAIPTILQDALAVSFDKSVGHDFFENVDSRFDFYHLKEDRVPFTLEYFNKITKGGCPRKTLNCVLAGVNVGKSLFLCDVAASSLRQGLNVLYITLEMAEEKIAERIDCNLLDVEIDELYKMKKEEYVSGVKEIEQKTHGKLIIKEYPTGCAHVGHFRALLEELKIKRNFLPDVICVDYINICASQKYKSTNFNSYFAVKATAEELRGLMVEYNCVGWTATQLTREGYSDSDFDMTATSECIFVDEEITLRDGTKKKIGDVNIADQITSHDSYKTVVMVHHKKKKECVKITLKSGKQIIVSKDHVFPTNNGRLSVNSGLSIGMKLNVAAGDKT